MQKFKYNAERQFVEIILYLADGTLVPKASPTENIIQLHPASGVINTLAATIYRDPEAAVRAGLLHPSKRTSKDIYNNIALKVKNLRDDLLPTGMSDIPALDVNNPVPWLTGWFGLVEDPMLVHGLVAESAMTCDIHDNGDEWVGVVVAALGLYSRRFCRSPADVANEPKMLALERALSTMDTTLLDWAREGTCWGDAVVKAELVVFGFAQYIQRFRYLTRDVAEHDVDPTWVLASITDAINSAAAGPELTELVDLFIFLLAFYPNSSVEHTERVRKLQERTDIDNCTKSVIWDRVQALNQCLTAEMEEKFKVFDFLKPSA